VTTPCVVISLSITRGKAALPIALDVAFTVETTAEEVARGDRYIPLLERLEGEEPDGKGSMPPAGLLCSALGAWRMGDCTKDRDGDCIEDRAGDCDGDRGGGGAIEDDDEGDDDDEVEDDEEDEEEDDGASVGECGGTEAVG